MSVVIDLAYLNSIAAGDQNFIQEILKMFIEHTLPDMEILKRNGQNRDMAKCSTIAHKMKSSVAMLGNQDATELVSYIEISAKTGENPDQVIAKIDEFDKVLETMANEIKEILQIPS